MTLEQILADMDLPEQRRDITRFDNVRWLLRNMHFRNSGHKHYKKAMELLKKMSKEMDRRRPMFGGPESVMGEQFQKDTENDLVLTALWSAAGGEE